MSDAVPVLAIAGLSYVLYSNSFPLTVPISFHCATWAFFGRFVSVSSVKKFAEGIDQLFENQSVYENKEKW